MKMKEQVVDEVLAKYGTPAFIFNTDVLKNRVKQIQDAFNGKAQLCYAMKANPFLIKELEDQIDGFEVCSPGELEICKRAGIAPEQIVLSGVNKMQQDLENAIMTYGVRHVTIESVHQFEIIDESSLEWKKDLHLLFRVTSGNQFGIDEEKIYELIERCKQNQYINVEGIQLYSGTQKKKDEILAKEIHALDEIAAKILKKCGVCIEKIEYGPGFFVPYFLNDHEVSENSLKVLCEEIEKLTFSGKIVLEMGRYIAATCGQYVTSIVDIKQNNGVNYCIVDGGINHLNYYGQAMAMKMMHHTVLKHKKSHGLEYVNIPENADKYTICGSLCTSADLIVKNMPLDNPEINDIIVFDNVGAYSVTEGIYLFLSRDMPRIFFYSEEKGLKLIRDVIQTNKLNYFI